MASNGYGPVIRQFGRLLGGGTAAGLEQGPLLRRFAADGDGAAFEALVARHGPMVLATCRRMLADPHDVDDAFQATFLVLARRAGSIRDADRLGPWLHGVARRVAARSRALSARRGALERPGAPGRAVAPAEADPAEALELRRALDEELARLPEKYRAPLVLCYLEGLTHDEAAQQLSWPVGTVRSRLAGGRDRLRSGLTRRGLSPSAAIPAALPASAVPEALISTTVRIATAAGSAPARVASLAKGALIAMMWNKMKAVAAVGLLAGLAAGGAGALAQSGGSGPAGAPKGDGGDPAAGLRADRERLKQELESIDRAIERIKFDSTDRIRDLEARAQEIRARSRELEDRWRAAVARAAGRVVAPQREPGPEAGTGGEGGGNGAAGPPGPEGAPARVIDLREGIVLVISGKNDRATILDTKSGQRKTCRLPGTATEVTPIVGPNMLAFTMSGPDLRRVAVFDFRADAWAWQDLRGPVDGKATPVLGHEEVSYSVGPTLYVYSSPAKRWGVMETRGGGFSAVSQDIGGSNLIAPAFRGREITQVSVMQIDTGESFPQDLREPATGELYPFAMSNAVLYQAGRFLYAFSSTAKKWSVLELKGAARLPNDSPLHNGTRAKRLVIPDGDLIHLYDPKAGEWTRIDTKDDK